MAYFYESNFPVVSSIPIPPDCGINKYDGNREASGLMSLIKDSAKVRTLKTLTDYKKELFYSIDLRKDLVFNIYIADHIRGVA